MDPFAKINPGQRLPGLPAMAWNELMEVAGWWKHNKNAIVAGTNRLLRRPGGIVTVKNATDAGLNWYSILRITGDGITPTDNLNHYKARIYLVGDEPDDDLQAPFVVLQEPLGAGKIGDAMLVGATQCKVDITDESHMFADLVDGECEHLVSAESGRIPIISKESGTGVKWAVVMLAGGGGSSCDDRNEIWHLTIAGSPTGGSFDLNVVVNGTPGLLEFNYDDDDSDVQAEFETHSEIASGDVTVSGGPFPDATVVVEFTGDLAATAIALPGADWTDLTGGTGVSVIVSRPQSGYPN